MSTNFFKKMHFDCFLVYVTHAFDLFCFNSKLILQNRPFIAVPLCEKLKNAGFISLKKRKEYL